MVRSAGALLYPCSAAGPTLAITCCVGAGGLNILPQKSWNVYGRENRLKVARDEAKHAEEERVRLEKQRQVQHSSQQQVVHPCYQT